jgi:hypothetical protein
LEDQKIGFFTKLALIQEADYRETSSASDHQQLKSHYREISKIQVPLVMGLVPFMLATKKGPVFVIYAMPITESIKRFEALPTRYKEYQDVFEEKKCRYSSSTPSV